MKILHVDPERGFSGGERQVLALIRHLAAAGHENLLAVPPEARIRERLPQRDARVVDLRLRNDFDLLGVARLRGWLRRESPDLLHLHTGRAAAIAPWLGAWRQRTVATRRMDYPLRAGWWTALRYRSIAAVAAISTAVERELRAGGVPTSKIRRIPSAVDAPAGLPSCAGRAAARRRFEIADADFAIVSVGALEHRKGHDLTIAALRELPARVVLRVAGEGSRRSDLESAVTEAGLGERIRFLGATSQVADLLAAGDLFVHPARAEGLGVAILEAMALGLPVVAARVGGIPDAVRDGETGRLVEADDALALRAAIEDLRQDPEGRRRLAAAGRERVLEHFSVAAMGAAYEALYNEVLGASSTVA